MPGIYATVLLLQIERTRVEGRGAGGGEAGSGSSQEGAGRLHGPHVSRPHGPSMAGARMDQGKGSRI